MGFAKIRSLGASSQASGAGKTVKSVQRGITSAAGVVAIDSVVMAKAVVISVSKGSRGTVQTTSSFAGIVKQSFYAFDTTTTVIPTTLRDRDVTGAMSGGVTDLTTAQYSARLTNAAELYCDGPVEWQVIEYL